ncbi:MAG: hypothetical protein WCG21_00090 [Eubacteriales bacterium]
MEDIKIQERNQIFADRKKELSDKLTAKTTISNIYSNVRMALFLAAFISAGAFALLKQTAYASISFGLFAAAFIVIVIIHSKIKNQIALLNSLTSIQDEYQSRIEHRFDKLPDSGEDFRDRSHDFSDDLDLFGSRSLFHLITIAQTWFGRKTLAEYLVSAQRKDKSVEEIQLRQQAVQELSVKIPMLQEFQAAGRLSRQSAEDPTKLLEYAKKKAGEKPLVSFTLCLFSAAVSAAFAVTAVLSAVSVISYVYPALIAVFQLCLVALNYQKFKPVFASVEDFYFELTAYAELFEDLENAQVSSEILIETQNILLSRIGDKASSASARVRKLHKICLFMQVRSQPILFFLLNIFFLYDNYCIFFLEKWKKESGSKLESYMRALGTWEALASLTTLTFVYPECAFPTFRESDGTKASQAYFVSKRMGHPLIPVDRQVRNDFSLPDGIALITGSNMSGKTTLLRTVGINAVLAYAGTICCSDYLLLGLMQIGSSMRIADDLGEGLSTFYAELLRIEKIITKGRSEEPLLFLIDEIFRGTNSRDRTDGAKIVLKNLSRDWIIGIMSTHDYELCSLDFQSGVEISNYHFSESYDELGIHFDYRLTPGVSVSANARYLMRMIGIE